MGSEVSESTMGVLENLSNIHFITKYYQFHLLKDEDDDKFVDCTITPILSSVMTEILMS